MPVQLREKYADEPDKMPHVNGSLTIGENIGDLSGVNIALKAYAFALDEQHGLPVDASPSGIEGALEMSPEIDGFSGLQRFFLGYAQIWRTKMRDELAEQYLQIDPHSPADDSYERHRAQRESVLQGLRRHRQRPHVAQTRGTRAHLVVSGRLANEHIGHIWLWGP